MKVLHGKAWASKGLLLQIFICVVGILLLWPHNASLFPSGMSDYTELAAVPARLVGSTGLYSPAANLVQQKELTGTDDPARLFVRLPWVALLWRPLAQLPYSTGIHVFSIAMLTCLVGFIWSRERSERSIAAMALCWSVPAVSAITVGQDVPLLLLLLSTGQSMICAYPFVAGALFAVGTMKWQLILFLPVVLLLRKEWHALSGFLVTAALLLLVCFVVQGPNWPLEYLGVLRMQAISRYPTIMPNLTGVLWRVPNRLYYEIPASVIVAVLTIWSARKCSSYEAVALAFIGGLLVSQHAYPQDALMIMPSALALLANRNRNFTQIILASVLLLPVTWMLALWGRCILVLAMIAVLIEAGFRHSPGSGLTVPSKEIRLTSPERA
jgi:hypothetical protein